MSIDTNIVSTCKYHVVFCTKYKRGVLTGDIKTRLEQIIHDVSREIGFDVLDTDINDAHVHLMLQVDPVIGVHKAVKSIKATSYRILSNEFPELKSRIPSLWARNYFASTVGYYSENDVEDFIESQECYTRSKKEQ